MASSTTAACKVDTFNMKYKCILTFLLTLFILTGISASGNNFPPGKNFAPESVSGVTVPSSITNDGIFQIFPISQTSFSQLTRNETHGKEENPVVKKRRLDGNSIGSSNKFNTKHHFGLEDERSALNYCDGDPSHSQEPKFSAETPVQGTESFNSGFSPNDFQNYQTPIHYNNPSGFIESVRRIILNCKSKNPYITLTGASTSLFNHLRETLGGLTFQNGKLEFSDQTVKRVKTINLPDLCWKAVKSYVEVVQWGLSVFKGPPNKGDYQLKRVIPSREEDQKELMSEVAQMVCVAIRFKFDEEKFFNLLDWYRVRMEGVWEKLLQSGNEFVKEVDEARKSFSLLRIRSIPQSNPTENIQPTVGRNVIQTIQEPVFIDQESNLNDDSSLQSSTYSYTTVKCFLIASTDPISLVTVQKRNLLLFTHLQENLGSLQRRKGKLEFRDSKNALSKTINLPDLSWEAVKSYVEVVKQGLSHDNGPPNTVDYQLDSRIPFKAGKKKKLMTHVAEMVCVAIRLKFDEEKFFTLLDWYKERMTGIWEELVESGDEFVKEVDEARKDFTFQSVQEPFADNLDQEKPFDDEYSLTRDTDDVKVFNIVSANTESLITMRESTGDLFTHLKEKFWTLQVQKGKMELDTKTVSTCKLITLPDLSWEAVRSYVTVTKRGLWYRHSPPKTKDYILAKDIPKNEKEQKELMIQVAQMVCVSIRFKFDEEKLCSLLDWYKTRMKGVWEELLQSESGDGYVKEVEKFRNSVDTAISVKSRSEITK